MAKHTIEIRRVWADEWRLFRDIRLAALEQDGDQFGQAYEDASRRTDAQWQEDAAMAAGSDEFLVVLALDGARAVGISGCIRREDFGKIIMVWVDPAYRGRGIGLRLVRATMAEARAPRYRLTVVEGNAPAIRTYERLGFTATGFSYVNGKGFREIEMERAGQPGEVSNSLSG